LSVALIFVVLAIALALGPVMMLRPSKSQQYISKLRTLAATKGLIVQTCVDPDHLGSGLCHYYLRLPSEMLEASWALHKLSYEHEGHFYREWDWQNGEYKGLGDEVNSAIKACLDSISPAFRAIAMTKLGLYVCCAERALGDDAEKSIAIIDAQLLSLREALQV